MTDEDQKLGVLIATQRALTNEVRQMRGELRETLADHETRIRAGEKWRYWVMGGAAVLGTMASQAWSWISKGGG